MDKDFRIIAMYLPQFYRTPENDAFWGEGFTDWVSMREAVPLFAGHDQPRRPAEGCYDPTDPAVLLRQARCAKEYGIDGFCLYHYWFGDGRKVLEKPAEILLEHPEIPLPYCFCWANDAWIRSWSRRTDGNPWADRYEARGKADDGEVLIEQDYGGEEAWRRHFAYLLPFFRDPRYITVNGCPVFLFYKTDLIPHKERMIALWRRLAKEAGLPGLYLIGSYREKEFLEEEGTAAMTDADLIHAPSQLLPYGKEDLSRGVRIFSCRDVWERILLAEGREGRRTLYGGFVGYDDTPRRGRAGMLLEGASPSLFGEYLTQLIRKNRIAGNELIFLNAWNEWGEGNYLEPDGSNGYAYLEAVRDVLLKKEYLTEKEYMISRLPEAMAPLAGKRIVLYGSGENARAILAALSAGKGTMNAAEGAAAETRDRETGTAARKTAPVILGVLDDRHEDGSFCGVPYLSRAACAALLPDAILAAAQVRSIEPVCQKLAPFARRLGVPVFDGYGVDQTALHKRAVAAKTLKSRAWDRLTAPYDAVSVDLLGTLFHRDPFVPERLVADRSCADMVRRISAGRDADGAPVQKKKIYFIATDELPDAAFEDALREQGLFGAGEFISSASLGRIKCNGLFRLLRLRHPEEKILHIGDDFSDDVVAPQLYGIDAAGYGFAIDARWKEQTEEERDARRAFLAGASREIAGLSLTGPRGREDAGLSLSGPRSRDVEERTEGKDVISFDIFGTLLMRTTPSEADFFALVGRMAEERGIFLPDFPTLRERAQGELTEPSLAEIYSEMASRGWIREEEVSLLAETELAAHRLVLWPVPGAAALLSSCRRRGKRIVLTSDMYLTSAMLAGLLSENGITGYEKIFVSCEMRKRKENGLFAEVRKALGEEARILHIGDDFLSDVKAAEAAGLDALLLMPDPAAPSPSAQSPAAASAAPSPSAQSPAAASTAQSPAVTGPAEAASPALTAAAKAYVRRTVAPYLAETMVWLLTKLLEKEGRERTRDGLLFPSRDGFLPYNIYTAFREAHPELRLPAGIYIRTSRAAAFRACADERALLLMLLKENPQLQPAEFLTGVCGLSREQCAPETPYDLTHREAYVMRHAAAIRQSAAAARTGLRRYLEKCGIRQDGRYGFFDFISAGSTQFFLRKGADLSLTGYYAGRRPGSSWLSENTYAYDEEGNFPEPFRAAELLMAEGAPSAAGYTGDGIPVFFAETRTPAELACSSAAREIILSVCRGRLEKPGDLRKKDAQAGAIQCIIRNAGNEGSADPAGTDKEAALYAQVLAELVTDEFTGGQHV